MEEKKKINIEQQKENREKKKQIEAYEYYLKNNQSSVDYDKNQINFRLKDETRQRKQQTEFIKAPLIVACEEGNIYICKCLIEHGVDVNVKTNLYTPLIAACLRGNVELCKYLIEKGADVNIKAGFSYDEKTPLIVACLSSNIELCKYLISKGADVNKKTYLYTPLIAACRSGNIELCKYLIEKGADVNIKTKYYTPLIAACVSGNIELCKYLIERGADVNIKTEMDDIPLIAACEEGNIEICKYLIEHGAEVNINTWYNTPLIAACKSGNTELCKYLISKGADINIKTDKYTPLIAACNRGHIEVCKYLIEEKGADVNIKTYWYTPLIAACSSGNIELCKYLLERGAYVNITNYIKNQTALDIAKKNNNRQICILLQNKKKTYINQLPSIFKKEKKVQNYEEQIKKHKENIGKLMREQEIEYIIDNPNIIYNVKYWEDKKICQIQYQIDLSDDRITHNSIQKIEKQLRENVQIKMKMERELKKVLEKYKNQQDKEEIEIEIDKMLTEWEESIMQIQKINIQDECKIQYYNMKNQPVLKQIYWQQSEALITQVEIKQSKNDDDYLKNLSEHYAEIDSEIWKQQKYGYECIDEMIGQLEKRKDNETECVDAWIETIIKYLGSRIYKKCIGRLVIQINDYKNDKLLNKNDIPINVVLRKENEQDKEIIKIIISMVQKSFERIEQGQETKQVLKELETSESIGINHNLINNNVMVGISWQRREKRHIEALLLLYDEEIITEFMQLLKCGQNQEQLIEEVYANTTIDSDINCRKLQYLFRKSFQQLSRIIQEYQNPLQMLLQLAIQEFENPRRQSLQFEQGHDRQKSIKLNNIFNTQQTRNVECNDNNNTQNVRIININNNLIKMIIVTGIIKSGGETICDNVNYLRVIRCECCISAHCWLQAICQQQRQILTQRLNEIDNLQEPIQYGIQEIRGYYRLPIIGSYPGGYPQYLYTETEGITVYTKKILDKIFEQGQKFYEYCPFQNEEEEFFRQGINAKCTFDEVIRQTNNRTEIQQDIIQYWQIIQNDLSKSQVLCIQVYEKINKQYRLNNYPIVKVQQREHKMIIGWYMIYVFIIKYVIQAVRYCSNFSQSNENIEIDDLQRSFSEGRYSGQQIRIGEDIRKWLEDVRNRFENYWIRNHERDQKHQTICSHINIQKMNCHIQQRNRSKYTIFYDNEQAGNFFKESIILEPGHATGNQEDVYNFLIIAFQLLQTQEIETINNECKKNFLDEIYRMYN